MKKLPKFMCALLVVIMVIGMLPAPASAAAKTPDKNMEFVNSEDGTPVLTFPMLYLKVTQRAGVGTHVKTAAFDVAGKDSGADGFYAPTDLTVMRVYHAASDKCNALFLQTATPVLLASGEVTTATIMLIHVSNADLSKYKVGDTIAAGSLVCKESSHGYATGNHLHVEVSNKPYSGIGWSKVSTITYNGKNVAIWALTDSVPADEAFFVDKRATTVLKENGYSFKEYINADMENTSRLMKLTKNSNALVYPQSGSRTERTYKKGALVFATQIAVNRDTQERYYKVDEGWIKADSLTVCEAESGGILWANQTIKAGNYRLVNKGSGKYVSYDTSKKTVQPSGTPGKNTVFSLSSEGSWDLLKPKGSKLLLNAGADNPTQSTKLNLYTNMEGDSTQAFVLQSVTQAYSPFGNAKAALFGKACVIRLAYDPSLCVTHVNGTLKLMPYNGADNQIWTFEKA